MPRRLRHRAAAPPPVNVWFTSTLMFSGNDTIFSRNVRLASMPRPPIRPRAENSGTSVRNSGVTSMTGSPAALNAATLKARTIGGFIALATPCAIACDGSATTL